MRRSKIEWRDHVWPLAIVAVVFVGWWFGWIGWGGSTRRLIESTTELLEKGEERNKEVERQLTPDP